MTDVCAVSLLFSFYKCLFSPSGITSGDQACKSKLCCLPLCGPVSVEACLEGSTRCLKDNKVYYDSRKLVVCVHWLLSYYCLDFFAYQLKKKSYRYTETFSLWWQGYDQVTNLLIFENCKNKCMDFVPCSEIRLATVSWHFEVIYDWKVMNVERLVLYNIYVNNSTIKIQFPV